MNSNRRTIETGKSMWQTFTVIVGVLSTITTLIGVAMTYRQAIQIHTTQGHISDQIATVEDHMSGLMSKMNASDGAPREADITRGPAKASGARGRPGRSDADALLLGLALDILKAPSSRQNHELKDYARHIVAAATGKWGVVITPQETRQLGAFLETRSGKPLPK